MDWRNTGALCFFLFLSSFSSSFLEVDLCAIFGAQLFPPPPPPHGHCTWALVLLLFLCCFFCCTELLSPVLTLTGDIVRALQIEEEGRGGEEENGEGAMDDCYYYTRQ